MKKKETRGRKKSTEPLQKKVCFSIYPATKVRWDKFKLASGKATDEFLNELMNVYEERKRNGVPRAAENSSYYYAS